MSKALADYTFIYDVLMDKNIEHQTFEAVSTVIQKKFAKHDFLSVGTLLSILIRQGDLPGIIQRVSAYYVMFDLFKNDGPNESLFLPVFLAVIESKKPITSNVEVIERNFLKQLLSTGTKDLAKVNTGYVIQHDVFPLLLELTAAKMQCFERHKQLPSTVRAGLMNIISAPTMSDSDVNSIKDLMQGLLAADTPIKNVVAPQFITVVPPLLPVEDELVWFDLTNPAWHKPIYDPTVTDIDAEAKRLVSLVFTEALNIQDRQVLLAELEKDPLMVNHIGLTPAKLPDLVENNPLFAIEILLKLMHSSQITEYLNVLVNMDMSLHSMEVVNRLTTSVDLPMEFVYLYISNCITTCETITDVYIQTRLVRLLCVLLQSLIRNKIINVKDLFIEVEAFCVEFSRIKEAAGLYRLIRQLDIGETATTGATTPGTSTSTTATATSTGSTPTGSSTPAPPPPTVGRPASKQTGSGKPSPSGAKQ